ncbi:MAG: hypothetical protein Q4A44_06445 [Bacteroidales bacterium]|nr:hypothetical protein [Bacteroidales bacterium]
MKDFPRWYLVLAFFSLWPLLLLPLYLVKRVYSSHVMLDVLAYLGINLIWIVPVLAFFAALNEHRRGYTQRAYVITTVVLLLSIVATCLFVG